MKMVKPSAMEMFNDNPQKHIEAIGRLCYKSEDKITETSHIGFIKKLYERLHWAMLEHYRFIVQVSEDIYRRLVSLAGSGAYINCTEVDTNGKGDVRYIVSASARGFMDAIAISKEYPYRYNSADTFAVNVVISGIVYHYGCAELFGDAGPWSYSGINCVNCIENTDAAKYTKTEKMVHGWHSVKFVCDRGVSHELVRHRPASFAQESTRYCNYSGGKYDSEITVIRPYLFDYGTEEYNHWFNVCKHAEDDYISMTEAGIQPQWARSILPNSLKTEIVVTANNSEWGHIIDLRYLGTTGSPHPQMVEVMKCLADKYDWAQKLTRRNE